jgi:enoyl-CoA hydratase
VRLVRLDRPEVLNALRTRLLGELREALAHAEHDDEVRAVVLTGDERAFAAGADIGELNAHDRVSIIADTRPTHWEAFRRFPKPLVAAVNGYCLGGGCELAMCADIIVAGDDARFGQPEINLGIIPGAGGTQRLTRAVGKSLAMKMVLTGAMIDAETALAAGLVSDVVPRELAVRKAIEIAQAIAAKAAVLKAYDTTIEAGLDFERRAFQMLFATEDKDEGTSAFLDKRKPEFKGR